MDGVDRGDDLPSPVDPRPGHKLHHTHLMASDVEATIRFWVECFGATVVADKALAGVRNVLLDVGGGRLNLYAQPPNHRGTVNHLGVQVTDIDSVVNHLTEAGWKPRPVRSDGALKYAMVEGPDQLLIEVFNFDQQTTEADLRAYFDLPPKHSPSNGPPSAEPPLGAGQLSAEASERLARPTPEPMRPPKDHNGAKVSQWRREVHKSWLAGDPPASAVGHKEIVVGRVRCLRAAEAAAPTTAEPIVVYFHGGGFALGSPEVALPITARIAGTDAGQDDKPIEVVSVDYRLAPEHPYPAAFDDGLLVVRSLSEKQPGRPIVLAGDSAGANVALAVGVELAAVVNISGLVMLSPHLNLDRGSGGDRSWPGQVRDPRSDVDETFGRWLTDGYRGSLAATDPRISPLFAEFSALPKTLVQVGTSDASFTDAVRFARLARGSGADVTLDVWDGLWHAWHYHRDLPEADQALDAVRRFVLAFR